jgi:hypothetical protein
MYIFKTTNAIHHVKKKPWPDNYISIALHVSHMNNTYNEHNKLQNNVIIAML